MGVCPGWGVRGNRLKVGFAFSGHGGHDDLMADIDWDAFDAIFPPGGESEAPEYQFLYPNAPGMLRDL